MKTTLLIIFLLTTAPAIASDAAYHFAEGFVNGYNGFHVQIPGNSIGEALKSNSIREQGIISQEYYDAEMAKFEKQKAEWAKQDAQAARCNDQKYYDKLYRAKHGDQAAADLAMMRWEKGIDQCNPR